MKDLWLFGNRRRICAANPHLVQCAVTCLVHTSRYTHTHTLTQTTDIVCVCVCDKWHSQWDYHHLLPLGSCMNNNETKYIHNSNNNQQRITSNIPLAPCQYLPAQLHTNTLGFSAGNVVLMVQPCWSMMWSAFLVIVFYRTHTHVHVSTTAAVFTGH